MRGCWEICYISNIQKYLLQLYSIKCFNIDPIIDLCIPYFESSGLPLGKACDRTRTHWYTPPKNSRRAFLRTPTLSSIYFYMMQYQEVILGPLLDDQTMLKKWRDTNSTAPHASQCLRL